MGLSKVCGASVRVVAAAVPDSAISVQDYEAQFGARAVSKISRSTGIKSFRVAPRDVCTSDLCFAAAERIFDEGCFSRDEIDGLIFVSQTPDYVLPATSCMLQARLGLASSCASFDINLGCSGYVYGLWVASTLVASGQAKRVLLLVGDTISKLASPEDRSVAMLFGDAGTATIVTQAESDEELLFSIGTDGGGWDNIIVRESAFRERPSAASMERVEVDSGRRAPAELVMNGGAVFEFTQSVIPESIGRLFEFGGISATDIDLFIPHQANGFLISHLARKIGFDQSQLLNGISERGNTSSASIPLSVVTNRAQYQTADRVLMSGFGVGLSWASAILNASDTIVLPEVEVSKYG